MAGLPDGTLTFMLTDLVGSTRAWESAPAAMREAMAGHDRIVDHCLSQHQGLEVPSGRAGDSILAVFPGAGDAAACALALQRAFAAERWPAGADLEIRVALHSGEAQLRQGQYYGQVLNRCARLLATCHGGQVLLTSASEQLLVDELPARAELRDLGMHHLKDLTRPEHVFELVDADHRREFPPIRSQEQPTNLPIQLTTFIGRAQEVHDVKERLSSVRLLTLTGIGGVGKTRLALQVAHQMHSVYPQGMWFVDLATLTDPAFLPDAIASVLGLRELSGRTVVDGLIGFLRSRKALLILDNCEHLVEPVAGLATELLRSSAELTILATSREPLEIMGEAIVRVDPLPIPEPGRAASPADVLGYAAVALVVDRARLAVSSFELSDLNLATVIKICERLEGIPLAIELACAKFAVLPLEQVSARLDDRFRLLAGSKRATVPRHQTLEAALDWSYDLLDEREGTLLNRLSVFAGGAGLEAVEAVCGGEAVGQEILAPLSRLVSKSLVTLREDDGEAGYRLLETVRSYASGRLSATGEAERMRDRHFDCYLALAEEAHGELFKANQRVWIRRLEREYDNIRTALEWSTTRRPDDCLRLAIALADFWFRKARYNEGLEWLQRALASSSDRSGSRATGLTALGVMARWRGDHDLARQVLTEALRLADAAGHQAAKAWAAEKLAMVLEDEGDADAFPLYEASVALGRKANRLRLPSALNNLGSALHYRGDRNGTPRALLEEGLMLAREQGDQWAVAAILDSIAQVALDTGDFETAGRHWKESLTIADREGHQYLVDGSLQGVAKLSLLRGRPEGALRLLGAAERYRRENGLPLPVGPEADKFQQLLRDARQALPRDEAELAWTGGQHMPLNEVLEYAAQESTAAQPAAAG